MGTADGGEATRYLPRPPRYPIAAALEYRAASEAEWRRGTTVNISRSGILFRGEENLELKTILEMRILLSADMLGGEGAIVECWGPVIRQAPPDSADPRPGLAASFMRCRLRHD